MTFSTEQLIMFISLLITLLLLVFAVDWRYFRDWVVVFLFKANLDLLLGSMVVNKQLIAYPVRFLAGHFDTSLLFELWVFPVLCILYNQATRERGPGPIIYYAILLSAGITAVEYPLELFTGLIEYINWHWLYTFIGLVAAFLLSRVFIGFFRWGCRYFGRFG